MACDLSALIENTGRLGPRMWMVLAQRGRPACGIPGDGIMGDEGFAKDMRCHPLRRAAAGPDMDHGVPPHDPSVPLSGIPARPGAVSGFPDRPPGSCPVGLIH